MKMFIYRVEKRDTDTLSVYLSVADEGSRPRHCGALLLNVDEWRALRHLLLYGPGQMLAEVTASEQPAGVRA